MDRLDVKIDDFYKYFDKNDSKNFPSLSQDSKHQKVNFALYKKIILKFLTIYFYDVYFLKRDLYFFLGGRIQTVKCGNWIRIDGKTKNTDSKKLKKTKPAIGLYWYNRPCLRMKYAVRLLKIKGSTSRLQKLDEEYSKQNDILELKSVSTLKKEGKHLSKKYSKQC